MFRQAEKETVRSATELIALAKEAFRSRRLRPGDRFASPDQISKLTGATVAESLDAVTVLLKTGSISR